jgi:Lrp/AsnC family leucine-responsive transcriptional regulator
LEGVVELDKYDSLILEMLQRDGRTSLTEISRKVGLSRFAIRARVEKLFQDGVVLGAAITVNPLLVGFNRTVFFEFKTNPHEPWLAKLLEQNPSCDLLDGIAGEYSLFGRFRFTDDEHFNRILKTVDDAMGKTYFKKYRVVNAIKIFKEAGATFKAERRERLKLDEVDFKILEILLNQTECANAPLPLSTVELSRSLLSFGIKISQPAVFSRLSRLEEKGAILRHSVRVDYSRLGLRSKFIVRVKANPNAYDIVAQEVLTSMAEISDLYRTGEEYGLLAVLRVRDISEYNSFLLKLYDSKDILDTYTTLVLEEWKNSPLSFQQD